MRMLGSLVAAGLICSALLVSSCGSSAGDASNPCTAPATDYVFLADKGVDLSDAGSEMGAAVEENRGAIIAARGVKGVPAAEQAFETYLAAIDTYVQDLNGHPFASDWGRSVKEDLQRLVPELRATVEGLLKDDISLTEFGEKARSLVQQGRSGDQGLPDELHDDERGRANGGQGASVGAIAVSPWVICRAMAWRPSPRETTRLQQRQVPPVRARSRPVPQSPISRQL